MKKFLFSLAVLFAGVASAHQYQPTEMSDSIDFGAYTGEGALTEYVQAFFPNGMNLVAGVCPGQYEPSSVARVQEVYARYEAWWIGESGEDEQTILADMIAAVDGLVLNQIKTGYYYIQPHREIGGVAGLVHDQEGLIATSAFDRPETLTVEAAEYLWYFYPASDVATQELYGESKDNAYYIQNFGTGAYASNELLELPGGRDKGFTTAAAPSVYLFDYLDVVPGTVYIYTHAIAGECTGDDGCVNCAAWNQMSFSPYTIVKWNARWDEGNMMYLYPVDESEVEAIRDQVVPHRNLKKLSKLVEEAKTLYAHGEVFVPKGVELDGDFANHGFVNADNGINLTSNAPEPTEGALEYLIDNDYSTYFHSNWSSFNETPKPHNLVIDLGEGNTLQEVAVKMLKRQSSEFNANRAPTELMVYATNMNPDGDSIQWNYQGLMSVQYANSYIYNDIVNANTVGVGGMKMKGAFRYIRFDVINNLNNEVQNFFAISEFGVYEAQYDELRSYNASMPASVKTAIQQGIALAEARIANNNVTEQLVEQFAAALEAYKQYCIDPSAFHQAVAELKSVVENLPVDYDGSMGIGYYSGAAYAKLQATLAALLEKAQHVLTADEIVAGIAQAQAAIDEFKQSLALPEAGSYIRIRSCSPRYELGGGYVYTRGHGQNNDALVAQTNPVGTMPEYEEMLANSLGALWYVEEVQGNTMALRNVANGLYLQGGITGQYVPAKLGVDKTMIEVEADGLMNGGLFNFIIGYNSGDMENYYLDSNYPTYTTVSWMSSGGNNNATYAIEYADVANVEQAVYTLAMGTNAVKFVTLPITATLASDDAYVYSVAGYCATDQMLYFDRIAVGSQIEAGTPFLVVTNDYVPVVKFTQNGAIASLDELNYSYENKAYNGLVANQFASRVDGGYYYLTSAGQLAPAEYYWDGGHMVGQFIDVLSAYVDPASLPVLDANPGVVLGDYTTGYALALQYGDAVMATDLLLNFSAVTLEEGASTQLIATIYPEDATVKSVEWSTSDPEVAIVENGVVTAVAPGVATIYATTKDGSNLTATCDVRVTRKEVIDATNPADYPNVIFANPTEITPGVEFELPIMMNNTEDIISYQFDIEIPAGFSIKLDEDGYEVISQTSERNKRSHTLAYETQADGSIRFVSYSNKNDAYIGNSGAVMNITLVADQSVAPGYYDVVVKNIVMTKNDAATAFEIPVVKTAIAVVNYDPAAYANVIYSENGEIKVGEDFVLPILMRNTEDIISYQVDVVLPEGIEVKTDEEGYLMVENAADRNKRSHIIEAAKLSDGVIRIVSYSSKNDAYVGNEGAVANLTLVVTGELEDGEYEISYKNIVMTKADVNTAFEVPHVKAPITVSNLMIGDVNKDGKINVSDVSGVVSLVLQGDAAPYVRAADINGDGQLNVSDVSGVVSITLSGAFSNKLDAPAAPAAMTTYNEVASSVFIEPFQINPGEEKEILVNLNNPDLGVISFQFDLTLPEGLEIAYEEEDGEKYFFVDKGSRLPRSYQVESTQFADGKYRIVAYSNKNDLVKGTSGDIIAITVKAADTMADGIYTINFSETVLTEEVDEMSVSVYPENTSCAVSVGNATGIEGVDAAAARQTIYDLYGRPTDAKQRGIYIINGKKVMK